MATLGNRRVIVASDPIAHQLSLRPPLPLADALARQPNIKIIEADPEGDHAALRKLTLWCLRFSPLVAMDGIDGILLDITGCETIWKGEKNLLHQVTSRLRRYFSCKAAIASYMGAAWGLARFGEEDFIASKINLYDTLRHLPIEALRIDALLTENMRRLGFQQIGDLYAVKRASLATRFGHGLIERMKQVLGEEGEAFASILPPPEFRTSLSFSEPIGTAEDIHRALSLLLPKLCGEMELQGKGARYIRFVCYRVDETRSEVSIGLAKPSVSSPHLYHLFRDRLQEIEPGFGIEQVVLEAPKTEPLSIQQMDWDEEGTKAPLAELIDRLSNRLGSENIYRWAPVESYIPERAVKKLAALDVLPARAWKAHPQKRPLRLLLYPEPIEALAPIPDDPPVQFKWRHTLYRVRKASGPERIEPEWWHKIRIDFKEEPLRDYYHVEDEGGHAFWLYRGGLYTSRQKPRWFLHGFFY